MKFQCFIETCEKKPIVFCFCKGQSEYICEEHAGIHINQDVSNIHKLLNIYKNINNISQNDSINLLKQMINQNIELKTKVSKNAENIIMIYNKMIKYLTELNRFLFQNIKEITKHQRIIVSESFHQELSWELYNKKNYAINDIRVLITKSIKSSNIKSLEEDFKLNCDEQSALFNKILNINFDENNNFGENELIFFKKSTKTLYRFNPQNESINYIEIDTLKNNISSSSICKINRENIFHYNKGISKLINIFNCSVIDLPSGVIAEQSSCEYFYNRIYIFGGYSTTAISDSRYFDLGKLKWISIDPLPSKAHYISTLLLSQKILISGYLGYLNLYNIWKNQYRGINIGENISQKNILIFYKGKVFFINDSSVYECENYRYTKIWKKQTSSISLGIANSKPCYHGKYAFFLVDDFKIFRFNCEQLYGGLIKYIY